MHAHSFNIVISTHTVAKEGGRRYCQGHQGLERPENQSSADSEEQTGNNLCGSDSICSSHQGTQGASEGQEEGQTWLVYYVWCVEWGRYCTCYFC